MALESSESVLSHPASEASQLLSWSSFTTNVHREWVWHTQKTKDYFFHTVLLILLFKGSRLSQEKTMQLCRSYSWYKLSEPIKFWKINREWTKLCQFSPEKHAYHFQKANDECLSHLFLPSHSLQYNPVTYLIERLVTNTENQWLAHSRIWGLGMLLECCKNQ